MSISREGWPVLAGFAHFASKDRTMDIALVGHPTDGEGVLLDAGANIRAGEPIYSGRDGKAYSYWDAPRAQQCAKFLEG